MNEKSQAPALVLLSAAAGLVVAGVFGLISLYPLFTGARGWFYSTLTAHLSFAVHLWVPAAEAAVWSMAGAIAGVNVRPFRWIGPAFAVGAILFLAGSVHGFYRPLPMDYAPAFQSWVFAAGMALVYLAWLAASLTPFRVWMKMKRSAPNSPPPVALAGFMASSVAAWATLANALLAFLTAPESAAGAGYLQMVAFGPGHSIQFTRIILMTAVWIMVSDFADEGWRRNAIAVTYAAAAGFTLATPFIYTLEDPLTQTLGMTWTLALGVGLGTLTLAAGIIIISGMSRRSQAAPLVMVSMLCFIAGGAAPSLDDRESLALTAHYHGLLAGVSASYLGALTAARAGTTRPAALFGLGGFLMAVSFLWLTDTRLLRKTVAVEGVWADQPAAVVLLLLAAALAAAGAAWQTILYITGGARRG